MVAIADLERAAVLTDDVAVFREAALRHLAAVGTLDILTFAEQKGLLKFDRGRTAGFAVAVWGTKQDSQGTQSGVAAKLSGAGEVAGRLASRCEARADHTPFAARTRPPENRVPRPPERQHRKLFGKFFDKAFAVP